MKAYLILNQQAGAFAQHSDEVTPDDLVAACAEAGIDAVIERVTPRSIAGVLRAVVARRPDAVIVGGGDGTLGTAAGHLVGTSIPLGALPLGTYNHFARDIGTPAHWREAIAALAHATVRTVDVGEVNGRIFINNCSLGAYPEALAHREALRQRTGRSKTLAMLIASFFVLRRLRRMRLVLKTPEGSRTLRAPFVLVANNEYSGHLLDYNLRAHLDEGRLWLYTSRAHRRLTYLRLMWQCLFRRVDTLDHLERCSAAEFEILSLSGDIPIAIDGETVELKPPLRFRIRPRALAVLSPSSVPPHEDDSAPLRPSLRY